MATTAARLRTLEKALAACRAAREDRLAPFRADPARLMIAAGLTPDPWQASLLRSASKRILMLCARQSGKSTTAGFVALRDALEAPDGTVLVVSVSQRQSAELVRRVRTAVSALRGALSLVGESALQLEFSNRSRIVALPASEGSIRGYTGRTVIIDEASRVCDDVLAAVRPMLGTTDGRLVLLSTPFVRSGFFHDAWTGNERWERVKVTSAQNPRLTQEFLEEEQRTLGPRWFAMEHLCEFADGAGSLFDWQDISRAVDPRVQPLFPVPAAMKTTVGGPRVQPLFGGSR